MHNPCKPTLPPVPPQIGGWNHYGTSAIPVASLLITQKLTGARWQDRLGQIEAEGEQSDADMGSVRSGTSAVSTRYYTISIVADCVFAPFLSKDYRFSTHVNINSTLPNVILALIRHFLRTLENS